ncbi:MAG: rhomboid family intramembrane serine protease [Pseudomonadota bacterium]
MGLRDRIVTSWRGLPRVLQVLIGLQVIVWVALLPLPRDLVTRLLLIVGFSPPLFLEGSVWQLVTHPFVHAPADFFGLIFDVLLLWVLGGIFARRWRTRHFLFFIGVCAAAGALTGGLAAWAWPESFSPVLAGMDASVLGLFVAFHMIFGDEFVRLMGLSEPIRARWILYVVLGMDVLFFLTGSNPDLGAQVGGLVAGWLMVTGRWRPRKMQRWLEKKGSDVRWEKRRSRFKVIDGGRRPTRH